MSKQVDDILRRYERMNSADKGLIVSAFESCLSELEDQGGRIDQWPPEHTMQIAKEIMTAAQNGFNTRGSMIFAETARTSAHGAALLSLYLELRGLPGDQAVESRTKIEDWRRQQ
ncbi:hypothetical protein ABIB90_000538 [Bradyrhizobium sp. JR4.1]|uniref:hypothetical protein n=1 Tax=Bradyrhizobium sp. JR4.1 TaxID=3156372 RepID=UPI0033917DF7